MRRTGRFDGVTALSRIVAAVVMVCGVLVVSVSVEQGAVVNAADIPDEGLPAVVVPASNVVSERTELLESGVVGSNEVNDSFPQTDIRVTSFAEIGDVIYVGGKFTEVQVAATLERFDQAFLAAFDRDTGAWIDTFRPTLDGNVWDLKATADGRLVVAGQFQSVNGEPDTTGIAILDATTGAVDPTWRVDLTLTGSTRWPIARAIDIHDDFVYLAGNFTRVKGVDGITSRVGQIARVGLSTGLVDRSFRPDFDGVVFDVDATADRVYAVGNFFYVNDVWSIGAAVLQSADGQIVPGLERPIRSMISNTRNSYQQAILAVGDKVWQAGAQHHRAVYNESDYSLVRSWVSDPWGDAQALVELDGVVYVGTHANGETSLYQDAVNWPSLDGTTSSAPARWMEAMDAENPAHITEWYPQIGSENGEGSWEVFGDSAGCLWSGGDFNRGSFDGNTARYVGGFAKFCPVDSTPPAVPTNPTARAVGGGIDLAWDAAVDDGPGEVRYELLKNDGVFASFISTTTFRDPSGTATDRYFVRAMDETGNRSATTAVFTGEMVDTDGDGLNNDVDPDDDNDGVLDADDAFPLDPNESADTDGDGVGDNADQFPNDPNETVDSDGDGVGDNGDIDADNDGLPDDTENSVAGTVVQVVDDFETDRGWETDPNGTDTALTGLWEVADPEQTAFGAFVYQRDDAFSGSRALVTDASAGVSVGSFDIDGGITSVRSATIAVPSNAVSIDLRYYLAHANNASSADFLRISAQAGANSDVLLDVRGTASTRAAQWTEFSTDISGFAGQSIRLLVEAADGGGPSLVEAAVDQIEFTVVGTADTDGDGVVNMFDLDSDNDSIRDVVEAGLVDVDGNGVVDDLVNGQGTVPTPPDSDGDGIADYLDLESNNAANDGTAYDIAGGPYASLDSNGDGRLDAGDLGGGVDGNGNGIDDLAEGVVVPPADTSPPRTPQNLVGVVEADGDVTLTWTEPDDNVGVTGYIVTRNGVEIARTVEPTYVVPAPAAGSHWYQVRAFDAAGNQSRRTPSTRIDIAASPDNDTSPPRTPQNLTGTIEDNGDVSLSWVEPDDNVGVTGYIVFRNGVEIARTTLPAHVVPAPAVGSHWYQVRAFDAAGNEGNKTPSTRIDIVVSPEGDSRPPRTPQNLVGVIEANGDVTLTWTEPDDNVGVAGYIVYRNAVEIGRTTDPTFVVPAPAAGSHWYQVRAFDAAGNEGNKTPSTRIDI